MIEPFLEAHHRDLVERVRALAEKELRAHGPDDVDTESHAAKLARFLAEHDLFGAAIPPPHGYMDLRTLAAVREALAYYSHLADAVFATQGLGCHAVALVGTEIQRARWFPDIIRGNVLCAFALTEPETGSDLASARTRAERDGAVWRITGIKTLISNAGIAGLYTVLARSSESEGSRGLSLFLVDGQSHGIVVRPLAATASRPLGEVRFDATPALLLGVEGKGYSLVMEILENFRPSVGAAACGIAARALDESVRHVLARRQFGRPLSEMQSIQMSLAEMHTDLTAARLLVYRAAWLKDRGAAAIPGEAASAKLFATEMAQRVVDRAVQLHGGQGVMQGSTVERLYREVRMLRIEGGTSEVQKQIVARELLRERR